MPSTSLTVGSAERAPELTFAALQLHASELVEQDLLSGSLGAEASLTAIEVVTPSCYLAFAVHFENGHCR
jgi:hypothetical protein